MSSDQLQHTPLGRPSEYPTEYDPGQLCPLPRSLSWQAYGYDRAPWTGVDTWNAWEISWLNSQGLPQVAVGVFQVPADSANIIESKSLKLYLNSLSQSSFASMDEINGVIAKDLSSCAGSKVLTELYSLEDIVHPVQLASGQCIDSLDVSIADYQRDAGLLALQDNTDVEETLYSHLLKTNCPVTGQPDWGSVVVTYRGRQIQREALLKYIVSFREECDFHEQCTETIFLDIMQQCKPSELTVYTRYLRRGGIDINPWRSNSQAAPTNSRLSRQ